MKLLLLALVLGAVLILSYFGEPAERPAGDHGATPS